jgi:NAD(P)-dependent dehydrogenase (short-subunit alcohol dehydrogenase family)
MMIDQRGQEDPAGIDVGLDVVTGAFSYSGRAIAAELIRSGRQVRTITGHPGRAPQNSPIDVRPLDGAVRSLYALRRYQVRMSQVRPSINSRAASR